MAEDRESDKEFVCPTCGDIFDSPLALGRHTRTHKKSKGEGVSKTSSFLTEEDRSELREKERHIRELEMQLKEAKIAAELRKLQSVSEPPKEKTWILPDGTSFQGSSSDYRDLLQTYYQVQSVAKKATSNEENPSTIKSLLERLTDVEKALWEKKSEGLEKKIDYVLSRDPLDDAKSALQRFNQLASEQGLIKPNNTVQDSIRLKHTDAQLHMLNTGIDALGKKIDHSMQRADTLEKQVVPILSKIGDLYVDDFKARRRAQLGEPVPISDDEITLIQRNLEKNEVQQELSGKPEPQQESKPSQKHSSSKPAEKVFTGTNRYPGYTEGA